MTAARTPRTTTPKPTAKNTPVKPAAKKATKATVAAPKVARVPVLPPAVAAVRAAKAAVTRAASIASTDTATCKVCAQVLPVSKFPTTPPRAACCALDQDQGEAREEDNG